MDEQVVIIDEAAEQDISQIQDLARASWYATYRGILDDAFIERFLSRAYSTENLQRSVHSERSTFLVARDGERVIGMCHYGSPLFDDCIDRSELYRLYMHPDYWHRGTGTRLTNEMEGRLRAAGKTAVFCYVHSRNEIGKSFYLKRGFKHDPTQDKDDEWFMIKTL